MYTRETNFRKGGPGGASHCGELALRVLKLGLPTGGRGAALRVRQIGRKLHTAYINPSKNEGPRRPKTASRKPLEKRPQKVPLGPARGAPEPQSEKIKKI